MFNDGIHGRGFDATPAGRDWLGAGRREISELTPAMRPRMRDDTPEQAVHGTIMRAGAVHSEAEALRNAGPVTVFQRLCKTGAVRARLEGEAAAMQLTVQHRVAMLDQVYQTERSILRDVMDNVVAKTAGQLRVQTLEELARLMDELNDAWDARYHDFSIRLQGKLVAAQGILDDRLRARETQRLYATYDTMTDFGAQLLGHFVQLVAQRTAR